MGRNLLALALLGPALLESAETRILCRFDFGDDYQEVTPGHQPVSRVYRSPRFLWVNAVADGSRPDDPDPLLRDFATGREGEFWIGLDDGDYRLTVVMGDSRESHGPFAVLAGDRVVRDGIRTSPGKAVRETFTATATGGRLRLRFRAVSGATFVVNGLVVEGSPSKQMRVLFPQAPPDSLPAVDEVLRRGQTDARAALRRYCEWLLEHRLPNGFLGDYEASGRNVSYYWYSAAYPIRTLLAGYEIFGERRYLEAVTNILDRLVEEQLPNGAFAQTYRNKPTAKLSGQEVQHILERQWMNMADVGCIVTALAAACRYVPEPRRGAYLAAARKYCDEWAPRWQLSSGAFTNGMESGVAQTEPYSVATATEAAAFAALYAVTGEPRYLQTARRAAEFLLTNWTPDGRPVCFPHRLHNGGRKYVQPVTQFGDILYYHDGILLTQAHVKDESFRRKVRQVYSWHINGERGLLSSIGGNAWFPLQDAWDNSKTAGMVLPFLTLGREKAGARVTRALDLMRRFLCTPEFALRIGVMLDDPDLPWGGHSLQSWSSCSIAATGFAGLSVAEMVRPGLIYLSR